MRRALAALGALACLAPAAPASGAGLAYAVREGDHAAVLVFDPVKGGKKEIFSDKGLKISLTQRGKRGSFYPLAASRRALFAALSGTPTVYELSADGANKAKRLLEMQGIQSGPTATPFVNAAGDRVAYEATIYREGVQHNFVFVHDREKQLLQKDLGPGCQLQKGAWLADGRRALLCLSCARDGASASEQYLLSEAGDAMTRVPGTEKPFAVRKGHSAPSAGCAGVARDGALLVRLTDNPMDASGHPKRQRESRLVRVDTSGAKPPQEFPTQAAVGEFVSPSPDGAFVAFTDPAGALWVKNAKDGSERQVLPAAKPLRDYLLVGWMD